MENARLEITKRIHMAKKTASPRDKELDDRRTVTFEQAEGAERLPRQLQLGELSQELRSYLWAVIYSSLGKSIRRESIGGEVYFIDPWLSLLRSKHLLRDHKMVDEFSAYSQPLIDEIKYIYSFGDYVEVLGFTQWVLRQKECPVDLANGVKTALRLARSAYTLYCGDTIAPVSSEEEANALEAALNATDSKKMIGPHQHLKLSAEQLTQGNWAAGVRESIHAVEAAAKIFEPSAKTLEPALTSLSKQGVIHGALRSGFSSLYGFTSDEKGIRHSLSDKSEPDVDEVDAQYMLGACAAFVSYLVSRVREGRSRAT
jgi:hypothetical protein